MEKEELEDKSLGQLLQDTNVCDIVPPDQKVITIPDTASISEAIKILSSNRILSAPVEATQITDKRNRFVGFVDMMDLLGHILQMYEENRNTEKIGLYLHIWCQNIETLTVRGKEFSSHQIKDFVDFSHQNPFCTVHMNSKLPLLLSVFKKGIHRAAIVDDAYSIVHIVSQSNVTQFLAQHIQSLGPILQTTIGDINLGMKQRLAQVNSEAKAIHAFHHMWINKVSAVAVVDKFGVLLANLSVTDLRGLSQENFSSLLLPVLQFVKKFAPSNNTPFAVIDSSTFESVVLKFASTKVHRLWVVDEHAKPKGVISLTDIITLLHLRVEDMKQPMESIPAATQSQ